MTAKIIDGKAVAEKLNAETAAKVAAFAKAHGRVPGLAVVLVGEDPASQVYVRNKGRTTAAAGMLSVEHKLPAETGEADVLALVRRLNDDPKIDGILFQLPVPKHINSDRVIDAIDPKKDVDGFHVVNAGRLAVGFDGLFPCTPLGSLVLLDEAGVKLEGAEVVVVGRSNLVGKPIAQLLLRRNATVTVAHSRTRDLGAVCRRADVVIAAVGRPRMIQGDWIKPGAAVIDVGINRIEEGGKNRLVGDVDYDAAVKVAGAITPVPGGVGPMTIACLLRNTLISAERRVSK
ncbi:MAG: bifunctional methylenetetrahydrofolate dehydrogenase/methenyltetrahydrofolate cyclohydrolase FolD [Alphaproteobacteria bacterium]|nr:bifunctional methylenetetrahydrofolate dehydrogenase/methenyltetrahydrofolate cyclohydrolase FolD [Alphaproteobacteria bacterium]